MIKLKVDPDEALAFLEGIDNEAFSKALQDNWHVDKSGYIRAQSVLWLFCWAKTGMNKPETAEDAQAVFDAIFPFSYNFILSRVDHEWAQRKRYATRNIEMELEERIGSHNNYL
jgi:hypothetical protein